LIDRQSFKHLGKSYVWAAATSLYLGYILYLYQP